MSNWGTILFTALDTLIKVLLPVAAGYAITYFNKKVGRERFMLAREVITSIVASLEQQYRSGEIPKDDRFALAMEQGIKHTGLTEDQVAQLIKDAVFQMNVSMKKYDYNNVTPGFGLIGQNLAVNNSVEQPASPVSVPTQPESPVSVPEQPVTPVPVSEEPVTQVSFSQEPVGLENTLITPEK